MEDPVRKVAGGGTAGGDRWEGEDEDEDVKVGAGQGARLRGWALAAGGETRDPGAPPGPAGRGSRVSVGPKVPWFLGSLSWTAMWVAGGSLSGLTLRRVVAAWAPALHRGSALRPGT